MEIWGGNREISTTVSTPGLDAWVYSRPYARVAPATSGGDIHYLSSCATGRITRMIIADVSGHGAAVAAVAANLRRLMGRFSNYIDQSRFVAAVNARFGELAQENEAFSALFATAVVATYTADADELAICNAGHPRPLLYDSNTNRWSVLLLDPHPAHAADDGPANLPLGVLDPIRYDQRTVRLAERDLVLLYTDPLLEVQGPDGRQLGEAGLLELAASIGTAEPAHYLERLLARIREYAAGAVGGGPAADAFEFDDDVTLLLLRRNAQKPVPSPMLGALAAWRMARQSIGAVLGSGKPVSLPELSVANILGSVFQRTPGRKP
jgi:serine phosphatase RsbU (regulator of sigma subunit)